MLNPFKLKGELRDHVPVITSFYLPTSKEIHQGYTTHWDRDAIMKCMMKGEERVPFVTAVCERLKSIPEWEKKVGLPHPGDASQGCGA